MKHNSNIAFLAVLVVAMMSSVSLFNSCRPQYQFVKINSPGPVFAQKTDGHDVEVLPSDQESVPKGVEESAQVYNSAVDSPLVAANVSADAANNAGSAAATDLNESYTERRVHTPGGISEATLNSNEPYSEALRERAKDKAKEIESDLSSEDAAALKSSDHAIRKEAVEKILDKQLEKNEAYNRLPESRKSKIETILAKRATQMGRPDGSYAMGRLMLYLGLIILGVGIVLDFAVPVLGIIFTIIGLTLSILSFF